MPRCGRFRSFIREYKGSPRLEKTSFLLPFFILTIEVVLILHAISLREAYVILLTAILLIISTIEILLVSVEIHEKYQRDSSDRIFTIRLDDFITQSKEKNVKKIVMDFMEKYPEYTGNRGKIYHTSCQILQTHKEEDFDEKLTNKLKKFVILKKKQNVDDILEDFIKKYPSYKKYRIKIYEKICHILGREK